MGGRAYTIYAHNVIFCTGDKSYNALYESCKDVAAVVYNIGDSNTVADIRHAVRAGYLTGLEV